jgi:hypothetical protein
MLSGQPALAPGEDQNKQRDRLADPASVTVSGARLQAAVPVCLKSAPDDRAQATGVLPSAARRQPRGVGYRAQASEQGPDVRGVDPGQQPPARRQSGPALTAMVEERLL